MSPLKRGIRNRRLTLDVIMTNARAINITLLMNLPVRRASITFDRNDTSRCSSFFRTQPRVAMRRIMQIANYLCDHNEHLSIDQKWVPLNTFRFVGLRA